MNVIHYPQQYLNIPDVGITHHPHPPTTPTHPPTDIRIQEFFEVGGCGWEFKFRVGGVYIPCFFLTWTAVDNPPLRLVFKSLTNFAYWRQNITNEPFVGPNK